MSERRLPGGNTGGAVLVDGTVRRATGPWTPSVHALLSYLHAGGFRAAPRALGIDETGREVLSFMPGRTVRDQKPWPEWVRSEAALLDVGGWLRSYHEIVAGFVPPAGSHWRGSQRSWRPGDIIGHNDAAPYNAVCRAAPDGDSDPHGRPPTGRLIGFIDWDFAAPCAPIWDLMFTVFSWVPLHARDVAIGHGFTRFAERPGRLRRLLDAYGYAGTIDELLDVVDARIADHARGLQQAAAAGDPFFAQLNADGVVDALERARHQLDPDRDLFTDRTRRLLPITYAARRGAQTRLASASARDYSTDFGVPCDHAHLPCHSRQPSARQAAGPNQAHSVASASSPRGRLARAACSPSARCPRGFRG